MRESRTTTELTQRLSGPETPEAGNPRGFIAWISRLLVLLDAKQPKSVPGAARPASWFLPAAPPLARVLFWTALVYLVGYIARNARRELTKKNSSE